MYLDKIIEYKRIEVKEAKEVKKLETFIDKALFKGENQFYKNLCRKGINLIAEVKKASPSKGIIRADFDHIEIAKIYENEGAAAISVLTDSKSFIGDLRYLSEISQKITTPLLRKDFVVDEYQIYEAAANGASAVLLIGEVLEYSELLKFTELAYKLNLEVLLEVHSKEILKKALDTPAKIIGVNNRNLQTFEVDIMTAIRLREFIPFDKVAVSESGISSNKEIKMLEDNGVNAVLIGETFMREKDVGKKIREIMGS